MLGRGTRGKVCILSPESVATMTKVQTGDLNAGFTPGLGFGLGWGVVRTPTGITAMLSPGTSTDCSVEGGPNQSGAGGRGGFRSIRPSASAQSWPTVAGLSSLR